ncbi:hypothetical protein KKI93_19210 [Xenorhabdus bovienii]|uniref:hypothetical protein n=1 Tax=Xenorhabdus bovienii TaxID=40576 RepID=UPI0023B22CC1|nr:hypothetical protein [Xenorhabdus bovienii]MDE9566112.1 hypothetical protein [Xenorhabdus bovienii]
MPPLDIANAGYSPPAHILTVLLCLTVPTKYRLNQTASVPTRKIIVSAGILTQPICAIPHTTPTHCILLSQPPP